MKLEGHISAEFPFEPKYIKIGTETIHYFESGSDRVLLLHGFLANLYIWRNVIPQINGKKKIITLDFLGFGKSSFPADGNTTVGVQYKIITDFIEAKGLKNVTLFVQDIGSLEGML